MEQKGSIIQNKTDVTSSKVVKIWLGVEVILTLVSVILIQFLPKTAVILFLTVTLAIILTACAGTFLYLRYQKNPEVKQKSKYTSDKVRLQGKLTKLKSDLERTEKSLTENKTNEVKEIENSLHKIHMEFVKSGLRAAKIDSANIPGVGPKLKEKLKANRIYSAADIGAHIQNLEGFGKGKVQALMDWKDSILVQLEKAKPKNLPDAQLAEIHQKYIRQHDNLIKARESFQSELTEQGLELEAINRQLRRYEGISFFNYLKSGLFTDTKNKFLLRYGGIALMIFLGLGALIQSGFWVAAGGAVAIAKIPTSTPTPQPTFTPTYTLTPLPTSTPSITPSLTVTNTPTVTLTPTEDLSYFTIYECLPKNTTVQKGRVVEVVDGDTIHVRLDDGATYSVRYIGIDSPENGMPFYTESKTENFRLVSNKDVILIKDVSETDSFDRLLRYVIADGVFVNHELVQKGYATAEDYPPDISCSITLSSAQAITRSSQIGIWLPTQTLEPFGPNVVIVAVNKSAEYVDIKNIGNVEVVLTGWRLLSEKGNQSCSLSGVLSVGAILRIWAQTGDGTGYNCGFGNNIWNNSEPDPAVLFNAQGNEVSRW